MADEVIVADETPAEQTASEAVETTVEEVTEAPEVSEEATENTEKSEETQERVEPETEKSDSEEFQARYEGQDVTITISDELTEAAAGYGISPERLQELSNDLYSGDSFDLSEENRKALNEAGINNFLIDNYLNGLKLQNDKLLSDHAEGMKSQKEAREKAWTETQEIIGGGEEAWNAMSDWANENLNEQEMNDWDKIMASDNWYMQKLAIKDLHARSQASPTQAGDKESLHPAQADGSMTGKSVELFEANGGDTRSSSGGAISAAEFAKLMADPKYYTDMEFQKQADARRNLGISKGL